MRFLLSGEGPTDLGTTRPGLAGDEFVPGPMAVIVDRLVETRVDYSLLDTHQSGGHCIRYVRETELTQFGKKGPLLLPGVKFGKHNTLFTRNAQVLGQLAINETQVSEAWLLCGLKAHPYESCEVLEDAPGNDDSPNALKTRLAEVVGHAPNSDEQKQWVIDGTVDPLRIEMPSFQVFKAELSRAMDAALAKKGA